MAKRKYPPSLFVVGLVLNMIKTFYILLLAIGFFIARAFVPTIPLFVPLFILAFWVITALVIQTVMVIRVLKIEPDNEDVDRMFGGRREDVINFVNEKIKAQRFVDEQDYSEETDDKSSDSDEEGE